MASLVSPLADNTKFYVTAWDNGSVIAEYDTLSAAKKHCKSLGYVVKSTTRIVKSPVACVTADAKDLDRWDNNDNPIWSDEATTRCVIYNPRFK